MIIAAAVVLIVLIAGGSYLAMQPSTPSTSTSMSTAGTTSVSGVPVPNTDTLIEESAREPGPGGYDPCVYLGLRRQQRVLKRLRTTSQN